MPGDDDPGTGAHPGGSATEPLSVRYHRQASGFGMQRPPASLPTALAGLAALLAGIGVAILGAEVVMSATSEVVAALVAVAYGAGGLVLMARGRGPQQAAGAAATAVAVPLALGFVILGEGTADPDEPTLVLALSTVAWAAFHLSGPGRGRPVFLSAALVGAWLTVVAQVGLEALLLVTPFGGSRFLFSGPPDTAVTVVLSLVFGVVYLWAGFGIHRARLPGTATSFVGAGLVAIAVGVAVGSVGREAWVPGVLLLTTGLFSGFVGTVLARRFSTWLGATASVAGLFVVVVDGLGASATVTGLTLALVGSVVAVATPWLADALGESEGEGGGEGGGEATDPAPPPGPESSGDQPRRRERPLRAR